MVGIYSYTSKARYEGEFKNGKRHGKGLLTSPDGSTLNAMFVDGVAIGTVERLSPNGYRYQGGWKNGKPEGKGQAKYTTGVQYEGDFKEGWREGTGIMTYPTGIRYEGSRKPAG